MSDTPPVLAFDTGLTQWLVTAVKWWHNTQCEGDRWQSRGGGKGDWFLIPGTVTSFVAIGVNVTRIPCSSPQRWTCSSRVLGKEVRARNSTRPWTTLAES